MVRIFVFAESPVGEDVPSKDIDLYPAILRHLHNIAPKGDLLTHRHFPDDFMIVDEPRLVLLRTERIDDGWVKRLYTAPNIVQRNVWKFRNLHHGWEGVRVPERQDACGAFDMGAVQALGDGEVAGNEKEVEWFQSETAAGRYLKAAVAAGENADEADVRLSDLQSRVAKAQPKPTKETTPDIEGDTSDNAVSNSEAVVETEAG